MLEKFDNQHDFERMCADILFALGYRDVELIAPRGGSDRGKDIVFTTESGGKGLACVTLRGDIEKKFFEDFSKRQPGEFEKYVFFCTAYLTHGMRNELHVWLKWFSRLVQVSHHLPERDQKYLYLMETQG